MQISHNQTLVIFNKLIKIYPVNVYVLICKYYRATNTHTIYIGIISVEMVINFVRFTSRLFLAPHISFKISKQVFSRKFSNQVKDLKMEKIIAIGQMRSTNDKAANRQQVQQIVESASQENASVCIQHTLLKCLYHTHNFEFNSVSVCILARML